MMLIYSLIESLSKTIMAGVHATGKIRLYQIVIGGFQVIILPIAYILLEIGYSPTVVLIAMIVIDVFAVFARMLMAKKIFDLSLSTYLFQVVVKVTIVTSVALVIPLLLRIMLEENIARFFIVVSVSIVTTCLSILYIGCTSIERMVIYRKVCSLLIKAKR